MKQKFSILFSVLILFTLFTGCKEEKLGEDVPPIVEEEMGEPYFPNVDVIYYSETYVGSVSSEMKETLNVTLSNSTGSISDATRLIILGSLNEVDYNLLESAYLKGATIAVENPDVTEFDNFFSNHPEWNGYVSGTPLSQALLYSFDMNDCILMVNRPDEINLSEYDPDDGVEEEEVDPELLKGDVIIPEFEDPTPKYYLNLRPWLTHLAEDDKMELDGAGQSEFDSFSSAQHINASMLFYINPVVRKIASSKPDSIKGATMSVDVNLSVNQIHVYEGAEGAGNYFIVYNDTEFNSQNAFKGLFHHRHGGVHVKGVGFYAKELKISFQLLDNRGNTVPVIFPGICPPEPDNVNNATSYSRTSSFNIGGSLSISAGYDKDGPSAEVGGKVSAGWQWSREVSANISDVSVLKTVDGNKPGWKLEFNNTPYFETGNKYWINLGTNTNSRSSQSLKSAWVWYDPTGKDDQIVGPYQIRIKVEGEYEAASYYATKADWKKVRKPIKSVVKNGNDSTLIEGKEITIGLRKQLDTGSVGRIVLKNNFKNSYINYIKLTSRPKKELFTSNKEYEKVASYGPKSEIDLGYYKSKDMFYKIEFSAKEEGKDVEEWYEYYLAGQDEFSLEKGKTLELNAPNDFVHQ